ncbi:glycoside hydrolase family 28 protein [Flavobacterium cellulosilyticum]|uniref:Glycoside hydrolase family 28 protein n=1 Tax=Flavobacterium cellulosilyticum TaxID=2541731 RepID=A0A4V2YYR3_9FLAO|nr:glycoside hydrolase family 28 protein [Flavobacterium cellulosilyticum]TDD94087.1 glycoside hydrolase family 28 protein [Flavobacterium cellulosilyticum]
MSSLRKKFKTKNIIKFLLVALFISTTANAQKDLDTKKYWKQKEAIVCGIKKTNFHAKKYNIIKYGAISNGIFDNTLVIKKAIEACTKNGGGMVLIPKGKYLSGAIHLENNVNLHLEEGAEIIFSVNPKDYLPLVHTSFEGTELMNYSPLVYAYKKTNVAITGKGILNGQGSNKNWWPWSSGSQYGFVKGAPSQKDPENRIRLVEMAEEGLPVDKRVFGEGHYLRPSFVEFFECNKVLIQDVTITNAPFWVIHPIKSTNVIVDGVTVQSHGPNNDGCDPEYSKNVLIKNCTFNTGDDCIAIKSGRDADGRRVAMKSENIIVQDCKMIDGHGGVVIGSEISGGVSNVYVENCVMDSPNLERAIRIKTNSNRGGLIENVYVRNLEVGQVKETLLKLNMFYEVYGAKPGTFIPQIQNIYLENIKVKNAGKFGILAKGYAESPIKNVNLKNVVIEKADKEYSIENLTGLNLIETYINGKKIESPKAE